MDLSSPQAIAAIIAGVVALITALATALMVTERRIMVDEKLARLKGEMDQELNRAKIEFDKELAEQKARLDQKTEFAAERVAHELMMDRTGIGDHFGSSNIISAGLTTTNCAKFLYELVQFDQWQPM